jgi:hypothetical protein
MEGIVKKILLMVTLNMFLFACSYAGFSVVKPSFGVSLDRPKTQEQIIMNTGDKPLKVKIYAEKPLDLKDEKLYMGDWVKVYPRYVTIPANGRKRVRFILRPSDGIEDGEYRCILYYEEVRGNEVAQDGLGFKLRVGTPIYGRFGNLMYAAEYRELKFEELEEGYKLSGKVENTGNTSFALRAKISFFDEKGRLLEEVDKKAAALFRGTTKEIWIELEEAKKASKATVLFYEKNQKHKYEEIFKL